MGLTALYMEEAPNRRCCWSAPSQNSFRKHASERCFDQAQGMNVSHRWAAAGSQRQVRDTIVGALLQIGSGRGWSR
ncbi:hypothetical protein DPM13_12930 [Paracoccus mutanolyticus]|uniref:Uncharacterized protein n=1 Tax=Paracoccus mutanolyticus TaxID=1499308 RepID=A0ABN5MBN0_9RHOB|nr:hypothetical protein DPM13_12930 [Paracoccus mutanolyticus]